MRILDSITVVNDATAVYRGPSALPRPQDWQLVIRHYIHA